MEAHQQQRDSIKPVVSILLPLLDESFLKDSLASIVEQDFPLNQMQLILVITGIKASTVSDLVPEQLAHATQIVECEVRGISHSLNMGLSYCSGEYIVRMDGDDLMLPSRISSQVNFLESNPDVLAVGGQLILIDVNGNEVGKKQYPLEDFKLRKQILEKSPLAHPATTIRKSALSKVGGYRPVPSEDTDLWVRILSEGKIMNVETFVLRYRIHEEQTSNYSINETNIPRELVWLSHFLASRGMKSMPEYDNGWGRWIEESKSKLELNHFEKFAISKTWVPNPTLRPYLLNAKKAGLLLRGKTILQILIQHPVLSYKWITFKAARVLFYRSKAHRQIGIP